MKVTLDERDSAYIYLVEKYPIPVRTVALSEVLPDMINLDFDADGRLIGIEVLGARSLLPAEFLDCFANLP